MKESLYQVAKDYVAIIEKIEADNNMPDSEQISKEEIAVLRSKYHQLLMDKLREEGIDFHDRFEAMNLAFEILRSPQQFLKKAI